MGMIEKWWSKLSPQEERERSWTRSAQAYELADFGDVLGPDGFCLPALLLAREIKIQFEALCSQPLVLSKYIELRHEVLEEYLRLVWDVIKGKDGDRYNFANLVLDCLGIIPRQEATHVFDVLAEAYEGGGRRPQVARFSYLREPVVAQLQPEKKILRNIAEAGGLIMASRLEGIRTVGVMAAFDYGTAGHNNFLNTAARIAGRYGQLFAFVASDEELRLTRDTPRPFTPLEQRVAAVASHQFVSYVCPLPWPEGKDALSYPDPDFIRIHDQLQLHIRYVGESDFRLNGFAEQCRRAGTFLVYEDERRSIRAGDLIKMTLAEQEKG